MPTYKLARCRINNTEPNTQRFWVLPMDDDPRLIVGDARGVPATLITSEPYDNLRSGRFENIPRDTVVMVMFEFDVEGVITDAFILGYTALATTSGTYGQTFESGDLGPGDLRVIDPLGSLFERLRKGTYRWFYNQFCQININRILQIITAKLNGIIISMRSGKFTWNWVRESDKTKWRLLITRGFLSPQDFSASVAKAIGDDDTVQHSASFHDRVDIRMMDDCVDTENVIELRTSVAENATDKAGSKYTKTSVGKGGALTYETLDKVSGNKSAISVMDGENAVSANVNDGKLVITMAHDGKVTFKVDEILLGGEGGEQALLTKGYDKWVARHTHSNGNQGAPTGPPLLPITPPTQPTRGKTNWHTVAVKAE